MTDWIQEANSLHLVVVHEFPKIMFSLVWSQPMRTFRNHVLQEFLSATMFDVVLRALVCAFLWAAETIPLSVHSRSCIPHESNAVLLFSSMENHWQVHLHTGLRSWQILHTTRACTPWHPQSLRSTVRSLKRKFLSHSFYFWIWDCLSIDRFL